MTFSIQNRPPWASFDSSTGRLSGTPGPTGVGRHAAIIIAVSDGRHSTQVGPFAAEVFPTQGSASLSWSSAVIYNEGSALADLAAYIIYYGQSPLTLDRFVGISSASETRHTIHGLSQATWYFAMTSYNARGVESDRSEVGSHPVVFE